MARHNVIGQKGEEIAAQFLKGKGFAIMDTNYLRKWGELDIVAKKGGIVHFVEVKTVSKNLDMVTHVTGNKVSKSFLGLNDVEYRPEDNVHYHKRERLKRIIQTYLLDKDVEEGEWLVDLIAVYLDTEGKKAVVDHIENIML